MLAELSTCVFRVKKTWPKNLDDTVTVELVLYLLLKADASIVEIKLETTKDCKATVWAVSITERQISLVEKLAGRVKHLEQSRLPVKNPTFVHREPAIGGRHNHLRKDICFRCEMTGYISQNFLQNTSTSRKTRNLQQQELTVRGWIYKQASVKKQNYGSQHHMSSTLERQ